MSAAPGCTASSEECDNQDNDCDGKVDEAVTRPCGPIAVGVCKPGTESCSAGAWGECVDATNPTDEICDPENADENCDGTSNEGCACATGETRMCGDPDGTCRQGTQTCVAGAWGMQCTGSVGPKTEVCDQARLDEDCDGMSNEGCDCYNGERKPCGNANPPCRQGSVTCSNGKWPQTCDGEVRGTQEVCDGVDNDCNGSVDQGGDSLCNDGQRCFGAGGCGECNRDTDCSSLPAVTCKTYRCDTARHTCVQIDASVGTTCNGQNKCTTNARCVECLQDSDCRSPETCVSNQCQKVARCGDGILDSGEACDDGNDEDEDACTSKCVVAKCGDGIVNRTGGMGTTVEQCDIGGMSDGKDGLSSGTRYDKYTCNQSGRTSCVRRYVLTKCTGEGTNAGGCPGGYCTGGLCHPQCTVNGNYDCTAVDANDGVCYGGACFPKCSSSNPCPNGIECGGNLAGSTVCL